MKEGKRSIQEGKKISFPSHDQRKREWISTNTKELNSRKYDYQGQRFESKRSVEDKAASTTKLQANSLDTLLIMQRGPSDKKFLFSGTLPFRSSRIQDRIEDSTFLH